MAKRKVSSNVEETVVDVHEYTGHEGSFWDKNHKLIMYGLGALALLFGAYYAYKNLYVAPQQKEAEGAMWQAQAQFERDSFKLALENPGGGYDGFLTIIDKFGSSEAGNSARYYAGVCYLQMGDFDNALKYLGDFKPDSDLLKIMKHGTMGDCYSEKKDFASAESSYEKAVSAANNDLLTSYYLKKLGMLQENQNKIADANKTYTRIKTEFPQGPDARDIDKFIARTTN